MCDDQHERDGSPNRPGSDVRAGTSLVDRASGPKRFTICASGSLGDLYPFLGLAVELRSHGHHVHIATNRFHLELVHSLGFECSDFPPHLDPSEDLALVAAAMHPARGSEVILRRFVFPYVEACLEALLPHARRSDCIVSSILCVAAPLAAHLCNVAWVSGLLSPMLLWSAHEPPVLPATCRIGRQRWLGPTFHRFVLSLALWISRRWCRPYDTLRRQLGMITTGNPLKEGLISHPLTLALWSPLFGAPQPDWPASVLPTGFMYYEPEPETPLDPQLEGFLAAGEPPVLITFGSAAIYLAAERLEAMLDGARTLGERCLFVLNEELLQRFGHHASETIHLTPAAPYAHVMPRCRGVVHPGGIGTTAEALRAGAPQLVVPWAHDQFDNAERVRRLGCGAVLRGRRVGARRFATALTEALDQPNLRTRCQEIASSLREEDGPSAAVHALEQRLAHHEKLC